MNGPARIAILPDGADARPASAADLATAIEASGGTVTSGRDAEGVVWTGWRHPEVLRDTLVGLPGVRWVQLVTAGIDGLVPALDTRRVWTSAKGCYSRPIAEYVLAGLLAGMRSLPGYARARQWRAQPARSLFGTCVTILGGGGIASALVEILGPFGCAVTVVRRSEDALAGAARTVRPAALPEVLGSTDVLVVAAALTPQTRGVIDAAALACLPDGAWLVNVGRGQHVVTDALVGALRRGLLGGAVLDVTDPEPLPPGHPLWTFENVIITPHTSCPYELAVPYLLARVRDNVARFGRGEALAGVVDVEAGY
jgi:phosphoglycerate dehydrogenase-like enzyme